MYFCSRWRETKWRYGFAPAIVHSGASSMFVRTLRDSKSCTRWNVRPRPWRARAAGLILVTSLSEKGNLTPARLQETRAGIEHGGLPGPVWPDQPGNRAERCSKADVVERDCAPETH